MEKLKDLWWCADRRLWGLSILVGLVITWLVNVVPLITSVVRVGVVYFLIYGGFAIWTGFSLKNHSRCWQLLVFPICFLVGIALFGARYSYYFALAYLAVAYLTWSMVRSE